MKILLAFLILSASCFAEEPCGLRSMTDTTPLPYPPIARAAHVEGIVILMATFKLSGEVQSVEILSGSPLLRGPASAYVQGLRANQYGGTRTCPMVIRHVLQPLDSETRPIEKKDIQHVTIYANQLPVYTIHDPAGKRIK
ncbi:MAG TPA: energy transducer TonB [Edaphobacter sp.]